MVLATANQQVLLLVVILYFIQLMEQVIRSNSLLSESVWRGIVFPKDTPDDFTDINADINGNYIDGLSITHGNLCQHIWMYAFH